MKEIGEKNITFNILASNDESDSDQLTQYLQSQWTKELRGIKVNITNVPEKSSNSRAQEGNFDIYLSHWGGDFNDPMTFMQIPMTGTSYNYGKWSDSNYDNLVKRAEGSFLKRKTVAAPRVVIKKVNKVPVAASSSAL